MEESDPQTTRKRPRLDSGSGVRETWSTGEASASPTDEQAPDDRTASDHEALASNRPASRVTINVKSPTTPTMTSENMTSAPEGPPTVQPESGAPPNDEDGTGTHASNAISLSSSPVQSPEIEVAELEDMDQDPSTSNWKPLGEALGDPDVVQLQDQPPLTDTFPKLRRDFELRDNLEEICAVIEKGPPNNVAVFLATKNWLEDVANNLEQLTYEVITIDRDFWEELPALVESLLRRTHDLQPDEGQELWTCLEEFFLSYAHMALHMIDMDTLVLTRAIEEDADVQVASDLISRTYMSALGWMLQINQIPFYRAMERIYGPEVSNLVARLNDQIASPPLDYFQHLLEYTSCILSLIPRWPQLAPHLASVTTLVHVIVESWSERKEFKAEEALVDSRVSPGVMKAASGLVRAIDEKYQESITKKLPWVTSDVSDLMLRNVSWTYFALSLRNSDLAEQIITDLALDLPGGITAEERAFLIHYAWKFSILKKHIIDGRMELRVHGMETMQLDLVQAWRQYIQHDPDGIEHPVVQFLAVTESPDPRAVSDILTMLSRTFHMHLATSPALLYLCSKLLELPLARFDTQMLLFCEELFRQIRDKHEERHQLLDTPHVDAIPLRLCVRLIRESAAADDLPDEQKAQLQKFASWQLSLFMTVGLSESDKLDTYERCVQDISEMNRFAVGSMQALTAILTPYDSQQIHKLASEFDLTRLVVHEIAHAVDKNHADSQDSFSETAFLSRVVLLTRIIDKVPESVTADLSDLLWHKVFMSTKLTQQGRKALWEMLCDIMKQSVRSNPFIDRCIHEYLPELSPTEGYFPEVLSFAKQTITYEARLNPPSIAGENEVVSIPGMERMWDIILTAPPGSIETEATAFAIDVYLDHNIIRRSPRSAAEATHIALVDRCVDQLKSAASKLKPSSGDVANESGETLTVELSESKVQAEELRFSRSLLFLRQFLQGLRSRPQYSPPQHSPPGLPGAPVKGDLISLRYQTFDGSAQSAVRILQIGDLSTASELVDRFVQLTGFSKMNIIFSGRRIDLLEKPNQTIRDLKLNTALLLLHRHPDSREVSSTGRRQSLTPVDSEVLKHFDDLYDLLSLEDHLSREIFDFLVVFPPQDRVLQLVKSTTSTEQELFPMDKPYVLLYSVNAFMICLREVVEPPPSQAFVSHSVNVLVAAITRPEMSKSLTDQPTRLMFATSLVECLLHALLVRPPPSDNSMSIPNSESLVKQVLHFIDAGQHLLASQMLEDDVKKLICHSFAILTEGSVRDQKFWSMVKQHVQFPQLMFSLLLEESLPAIRKGISENIATVCSPSRFLKKGGKCVDTEGPEMREDSIPEHPARIDILATIWDAFVQNFTHTLGYVRQSQEFFEIAHLVFRSVAERSPHDLIFNEYLKQWSGIMFRHRSEEFVGREPMDPLILGFCRLLKSCLDLASSSNTAVDTFDLTENLFDKYLFPDLSAPSSDTIVPQIPVLHSQTRQELYTVISLLCKYNANYSKVVERLDDIIPQGYTYSPAWCFDRHRMIRSPEGYAGLKNLSNTCYLNSLLTQLFMNVGFRDFILQLHLIDPESSQRLLDETKKVFGYMQETWLKCVDPQGLVDSIRTYDNEPVDVTVQMDVDEFYNLLFDRWEAQISGSQDKKKFRSFYGGQLVQQIKSKECPHISERLEPFSAIQCDIKGKASLEESLQAYVEGEIMQGDNKYSCTSCGRHVDAVKRACLKEVPDSLIFHLKRFDFDMVTMTRSKINDEFQFPERIDMSPFKVEYLSEQNTDIQEDSFELVGVLVHSGTAESGHYYSYIRERPSSSTTRSWVEFNDSDVSRFEPSKIADQCFGGYNDNPNPAAMGQVRYTKAWNAYMLFYERVSTMESAKSIYNPPTEHYPVRVQLPVPLANHIAMENEVFIRAYCLLDPYHALFVRYILGQLLEMKHAEDGENSRLNKQIIFIVMDTLEQLVSRASNPLGLDVIVAELVRAIDETPKAAYRVLQWVEHKPASIRNLVLKSPQPSVRNSSIRIFVCALSKLLELRNEADEGSLEREKWQMRYLEGFENVVATLEGLWSTLHTVGRSWDDYFEFLLLLASFGTEEAGMVLNYGFLLKCLEVLWVDRDDAKRLRRQYLAYCKLVEKGRRFSHRKLTELLSVLLANIDFSAPPTADDERRVLPTGRYSLTTSESDLIRPLGRNDELFVLRRILQQYSSPQACRNIVSVLLDAEPEAGLLDPICKVLEDGLRVAPADLCAPFLDATIIFCRRGPDEERIAAMLDYVAKGVDSINDSGGKEHLAFFTNVMSCHNDRLGLSEIWFLSQLIDRIPDWVPTLLMFPDRTIRNMTMEILRRILFTGETGDIGEDWQSRHAQVARELVYASIDKLRKLYLSVPENTLEAKTVETIKTVIDHCVDAYFDDSEQDQDIARQAHAVIGAVEEVAVDVREDLGSESDVHSPEEWDDNSVVSDSEMGMAGSP
ncbi:putative ubiquitin C-terminal hydrolase [Aspergillus tanneri]|uniref:USP domain-containing protein n=1 Tax=Aspergillus tanneri TaxID=1220188 RepID=A0A5M9NCR3_9EURO|nr:uncharacterized protein ATNIH1004_001261 [Aspergillus tanneri]KAA8652357.1 hypothetical protein ATNIH1004_001261 [Aspergillus tanneri]